MRWMRVGGGSTPVGVAPESTDTRGDGAVSISVTNDGSLVARVGANGGGCETRCGRAGGAACGPLPGEPTGAACGPLPGEAARAIGGGCDGLGERAKAVGDTGGDFESERLRR